MQTQLVYPMAVYVLYMWCAALLLFTTRIRSIKEGKVSIKYFKNFMAESLPEQMVLVGRHYDNQFQLPILFFITCLLQMQMNMTSTTTVVLAWCFVISRLFHSWFILGYNEVKLRVMAFATGWLMVLLLWVQLIYFLLNRGEM